MKKILAISAIVLATMITFSCKGGNKATEEGAEAQAQECSCCEDNVCAAEAADAAAAEVPAEVETAEDLVKIDDAAAPALTAAGELAE